MERNKYRLLTLDPRKVNLHEKRPLLERFNKKFSRTKECWIWHAGKNSSGYGMIHVNEFKTDITANRVSFMLFKGEIPVGMDVCHRCDNPACVNPEHLFPASNAENIQDAMIKGRSKLKGMPGLSNAMSKLNRADVIALRNGKPCYGFFERMAEKYKMNKSAIRKAFYRKSYRDVQ